MADVCCWYIYAGVFVNIVYKGEAFLSANRVSNFILATYTDRIIHAEPQIKLYKQFVHDSQKCMPSMGTKRMAMIRALNFSLPQR